MKKKCLRCKDKGWVTYQKDVPCGFCIGQELDIKACPDCSDKETKLDYDYKASDYEAIMAERDAAVHIAGEALDSYNWYLSKASPEATLIMLVKALEKIAIICPEISGRIKVTQNE